MEIVVQILLPWSGKYLDTHLLLGSLHVVLYVRNILQ